MVNYSLLKKLCLADGISGDENAVRELIIQEIKGYADYEIDNLGNLLVHKKGRQPSGCLPWFTDQRAGHTG